jgi:hypothetical protein
MPTDPRAKSRRGFLAMAACASLAAAVLSQLVLGPPTSTATNCPAGETKNERTGVCVPAPPKDVVEITTEPWIGLPEIDGVLCTGHNSYECIGLAEESRAAGPTPSAHSTFSSEATATSSIPRPTG